MDALFMSTWPAPQEPAGGGAGAGVGAGRGVAVGGGNGVAVGCGVFVGVGVKVAAGVGTGVTVGRDVGTGDGAGVAVGKGVGAGEGGETGVGAGDRTGTGVEEAGPSADSKPEAAAGWGVAVRFRVLDGTTDGEDATVGWRDAVGEGIGIAAAAGVTGNNGEMSGRINNPANIRDDPGWTRAGEGEGMTRAVGGAAVTLRTVGVGTGVVPGAETGDAQAMADPTTTTQQNRVRVSP